jgi:hypothetical protein
VLAEYTKRKDGKLLGDGLDQMLNKVAKQRFHNRSPLDFDKLKGDPDNIEKHLVSYIKGFSANVRTIFDYFEFEKEIEKMRESNILYLIVSKFSEVDLDPLKVRSEEMGLIFENLIRRFYEQANETAGDHFTPREVIRLMAGEACVADTERGHSLFDDRELHFKITGSLFALLLVGGQKLHAPLGQAGIPYHGSRVGLQVGNHFAQGLDEAEHRVGRFTARIGQVADGEKRAVGIVMSVDEQQAHGRRLTCTGRSEQIELHMVLGKPR